MTNSGVLSNRKGIREAKETAGAMQYAGASGMEAVAAYRAQLMAAEMSNMQVYGMLGAPGTYGAGAAADAAANPVTGSVYDTTGSLSQPDQGLKQSMPYSTGGKGLLGTPRAGILDPEAYAAKIMQSSSFRTRSALTAEAEQLANREGPLFDRLENSIIGVINEGAALSLRAQMREFRTQNARGTKGAAGPRRAAMQDARAIGIMENNMQKRIQQTWTAAMGFQKLMWEQIDNVQKGNTQFLEDLPMTNRAFLDAIGESAKMHVEAGEMASKIAAGAYHVKQSQQPVNFGVGLAEAVIGMASSWVVGELGPDGGGPAGMLNQASEKLRAGTEYAKGLISDQEPLQGPRTSTGMGPIDTHDQNTVGSAWSKLLGWTGGN
jgi:hypothetical protein